LAALLTGVCPILMAVHRRKAAPARSCGHAFFMFRFLARGSAGGLTFPSLDAPGAGWL
jgi:hypothetical protein